LNLSEKVFLGCGLINSKHQKTAKKINKEQQKEINVIIKEKEECENIIKKQKKLIEKMVEDNQKLENKIKDMENENYQISQKIDAQKENQEQLILLVKIIQKSGVDIEELIDKWNDEVENEIANIESDSINTESIPDSTNELNSKIDPSSFIPINIEKPLINKKVFKGIPKLNFDIIRNRSRENNEKKEKFINNSK
jgi:DNA repair ATPase RecN